MTRAEAIEEALRGLLEHADALARQHDIDHNHCDDTCPLRIARAALAMVEGEPNVQDFDCLLRTANDLYTERDALRKALEEIAQEGDIPTYRPDYLASLARAALSKAVLS